MRVVAQATYLTDGGVHKGEGWVVFKPTILTPGTYTLQLRTPAGCQQAGEARVVVRSKGAARSVFTSQLQLPAGAGAGATPGATLTLVGSAWLEGSPLGSGNTMNF